MGIPPSQRARMYDSNVGATERVLNAATAASVPRTIYVSTINAFGDTGGQIVLGGEIGRLRDAIVVAARLGADGPRSRQEEWDDPLAYYVA